jgi:pilus assembly protein CpaF
MDGLAAEELVLPDSGRFCIGRTQENDKTIPDKTVSRRHATISVEDGRYVLTDLGSTYGTYVRGEKIETPTPLDDGDEIRIGVARIVFSCGPSEGQGVRANTEARPAARCDTDFAVPEELYTDEVMALKRRIHEQILHNLNLRDNASRHLEDAEMKVKLERALDVVLMELRHELPASISLETLRGALLDELIAYGPITPMLNDPAITEVMVNSPSRIFVERNGLLATTQARFFDDSHLLTIIRRIVEKVGRHIDESNPRVDARLPDGSRVNAIIHPIALDGHSLTIRKFSEKKLTSNDLIAFGSMSRAMALFLQEAIRVKQNIVIAGGTGSGKTTLLSILSQHIPLGERLVTIEDSAELKLSHSNIVRLEARPANIEGRGKVTIQDLVTNALRMRPDRIIIGECRGSEAMDMLQAMNTGHDGSLTTIHANSPRDSLARLETMVMMAGYDLPSRAIRDQVASAINLIIQQTRFVDGSRKIVQISEVTGREGDVILMQDIFVYRQTGFTRDGKVEGEFLATGNKPRFIEEFSRKGDLKLDLSVFTRLEAAANRPMNP